MFIAGVIEWAGDKPPTPAAIAGRAIIEVGFAHLKVVTESGGSILGEAELQLLGQPITAESASLKTWGFGVPKRIAQRIDANDA